MNLREAPLPCLWPVRLLRAGHLWRLAVAVSVPRCPFAGFQRWPPTQDSRLKLLRVSRKEVKPLNGRLVQLVTLKGHRAKLGLYDCLLAIPRNQIALDDTPPLSSRVICADSAVPMLASNRAISLRKPFGRGGFSQYTGKALCFAPQK